MRRLLLITIFASLVIFSTLSAKIIGDFNDDGKVTFLDAIALIIHINGGKQIGDVGTVIGDNTEEDLIVARPTVDVSLPNGKTNESFAVEAVLTMHEIVDRVQAISVEKERERHFQFNGEYSGTADVKMRMPQDHNPSPCCSPKSDYFQIRLDNFSNDNQYFVSGDVVFYVQLHEWPFFRTTYDPYWYSAVLFFVGEKNADVVLSGKLLRSYGPDAKDDMIRYEGFIKSCDPAVLEVGDGNCYYAQIEADSIFVSQ